MKPKIFSIVFSMLILCYSITTAFAAQGTNGDELQVAEAQQLEIQLGTEWAGVEFELRTDAGVYPNPISVNENGVLSLEIGGSKKYILSCLKSPVTIPEILLQAPVTSEAEPNSEDLIDLMSMEPPIPNAHVIFFSVGLVIAIGILVAVYISNKKKAFVQNDEENDDN